MALKGWAHWGFLPLFLVFSAALSAADPKWEYLVKTYPLMGNDGVLTTELNKLGRLDWELVDCPESSAKIVCIFKRPINKED